MTLTTVGYGDYYPVTLAGRVFSFMICLAGLVFISLGFVSLINLIKLSIKEERAINVIKKLETFWNYKDRSAWLITAFFRLSKYKKSQKNNPNIYKWVRRVLLVDWFEEEKRKFRLIRKEIIDLYNELNFFHYVVHKVIDINHIMKTLLNQ